jgi:multidrug resistance efflux pump
MAVSIVDKTVVALADVVVELAADVKVAKAAAKAADAAKAAADLRDLPQAEHEAWFAAVELDELKRDLAMARAGLRAAKQARVAELNALLADNKATRKALLDARAEARFELDHGWGSPEFLATLELDLVNADEALLEHKRAASMARSMLRELAA